MIARTLRAACALLLLATPLALRAQTNGVAATVNGEKITTDQWVTKMQNLRAQDFLITVSPVRFRNETAGQVALESLINTKLLVQYATKLSLMPTDAEVKADLDNALKQPVVAENIKRGVYTEAQVREDLRTQRAMYNVATINQRVTPEEVRSYYTSHQSQWAAPETWSLAVIRTSTRAAADKALTQVNGGKPFETVAAAVSEDPATKAKGGEIGALAVSDPALPSFIRDAVLKLKVGGVTPVLQTTDTKNNPFFYIVKLLGRQQGRVPAFDDVKAQAERLALYDKAGGAETVAKKIGEFRKTSQITVNIPAYAGTK